MNKNLLLIFLLIFVLSDSVSKSPEAVQADEYELVFSDEFNLPNGSQPDSTKWGRSVRYTSIWNRWVSQSPRVVYIDKGHLVCKAIPNRTEKSDTATMLTGAIETLNKYSFQYGKVEVRLKTNTQRGNFPAAWLSPQPGGIDSRYGEIDIFETFGNIGCSQHTVHNHLTTILKKKGPENEFRKKIRVDRWHIYSIEWSAEKIIWFIDGEKVAEYHKSNDPQLLADGQWTFDRPFFLRLNQSVGDGSYEVMIPDVTKEYETRFDWIRVYQKRKR